MHFRRPSIALIRLGLGLALVAGLVVAGATVAHGDPDHVSVDITAYSGWVPGLTVTAGTTSAEKISLGDAVHGQQLGFSADKSTHPVTYQDPADPSGSTYYTICYVFRDWVVSVNHGFYTQLSTWKATTYTVPDDASYISINATYDTYDGSCADA
jgi:hypothetical protein